MPGYKYTVEEGLMIKQAMKDIAEFKQRHDILRPNCDIIIRKLKYILEFVQDMVQDRVQ